jgi:hypothetical protein
MSDRSTLVSRLAGRARYLRKRLRWMCRNLVGGWRARRELRGTDGQILDLTAYERRIRSQNGEDGIIDAIFGLIGTTDRYFVEFGVALGWRCNTAYLAHRRGWQGLMMDGQVTSRSAPEVREEFITAENIEGLFEKHGVPRVFDLLSIDIDGNDYWVWEAIKHYEPRVVIVEYNATIPPTESCTIPYDPEFVWDRSSFCGASLLALARLGASKGYRLVCCDSSGTNAFFILESLCPSRLPPKSVEELYRTSTRAIALGVPAERDPRFVEV